MRWLSFGLCMIVLMLLLGCTYQSVHAQSVLPPEATQGIYPQCQTAPDKIRVRLVSHLNNWPLGTLQFVDVDLNDYAHGVTMAELGPTLIEGPYVGNTWNAQATRALSIAARTYGIYYCQKHSFSDGTHGISDTGDNPLYPQYKDQEFNPYDTRFSAAQKQAFIAPLTTVDDQYLAYYRSSPNPRRQGVVIDAQHRRDNGNPTNSAWNGPNGYSGYAYLPSVYDVKTVGHDDGYGFAQTPANSWAMTNLNVATFAQFLSHYYPGTHIMNKQPQFSATFYNNHDAFGCTGSNIYNTTTTSINYDWGTGSPAPAVPTDNFCVRWNATASFAADWYTFFIVADDGFILSIDNNGILGKWFDQGPTLYSVSVPMTAGNHLITLSYYESSGGAVARLF